MPKKRPVPLFPCPHCGEPVREDALACWSCGSDAKTGWSDAAETGGVDLGSDDDFDYDEFLQRELGAPPQPGNSLRTYGVVALIVLVVLLLVF